uniref:DNA 5'-3' helicase n=1 Tax=Melanthalia intermedia TaxID=172989 RepID=A0A345UAZ0_9FLOR|nr:replication helicase subunit [Melanthalia intermedia]AXI97626.1 replication helicase subunit [Melanthalia intermedia]
MLYDSIFYSNSFPPQNYVAEEILLGAILINPMIFPQVVPVLKEESFFLESHKLIYKNLIFVYTNDHVDSLQLFYSLNESNVFQLIGGPHKIMELMKQGHMFMSSIDICGYIEELVSIINDNYVKRLMIQYGHNVVRLAYVNKLPSHQLYNKASEYLESTVHKMPKENLSTFKDLLASLLVRLKHQQVISCHSPQAKEYFMLSGFYQLDQLIQGFRGSDLIVIAGRPSVGKTSFVINIVFNILRSSRVGVCFFSLEISKVQIVQKFLAVACGISTQYISLNQITSDQWCAINQICNDLIKYSIYINDTPNMSVDYIEYTSKLLYRETKNVNLIVIDYLQLIQVENFNSNTRSQELSYVTRKLKLLAQYLNIPVLVLSQLNRSIETRMNKKPLLSDLRESGCLSASTFLDIDLYNTLKGRSFYNSDIFRQQNLVKSFHYKFFLQSVWVDFYWKTMLQYVFFFFFDKSFLVLTHNHKIYSRQNWAMQNCLLEEDICMLNSFFFNVNMILEFFYIKNISYSEYVKVYDIHNPMHLTLLSNQLVLHNSIEQDSDMVIILSQQEDNKSNNKIHRLINLTLCKNRNGPTGVCQLSFVPENNIFSNF